MSDSPVVQFKFNIPTALKDRLTEAAERSGRSLTSEILTRLQASLSLADDKGLDFTAEAFERFILEIVANGTEDLANRVHDLEVELREQQQGLNSVWGAISKLR